MEPQDTKSRLIQAATHLFAKKGFEGTSVKELAETAGVNVSLVSYHFGGKEGLYRACLEVFGTTKLAKAERLLTPAASLEEFRIRLKLFLEELLLAQVEEPELTEIIHREIAMQNDWVEDIFRNSFLKTFKVLVDFHSQAQAAGLLDPSLDPNLMAGLSFGSVIHAARSNHVNSKYFGRNIADPQYRELLVDHAVRAATTGYARPTPKRGEK